MLYKPCGRTGKKISAVSFGGMRFDTTQTNQANAELLVYALERGINYFDTAPAYGVSEDIFGLAFRQMPREKFYVATKSSQASGEGLRADLERSLERMGVDRIDFFHIWWVLSREAWERRKLGGAVEAALKAKQEGLVSHVAISSHMAGAELRDVLAEGYVESVLLGYCAINFPYRQEALLAAGELGLGAFTMNPLGGGIIPRHPERFDFLREPDDPSVVTAALRFNVSNPHITSALVGFTTKAHIDEAVAAMEDFHPYDQGHMAALRERVIREFNDICTGCAYCMPCPQGVDIPKMMDVYNFMMLVGRGKGARNRMALHWEISPADAEACNECGQCEAQCTQHLPIIERLKEIAALAEDKEDN